MSQQATMTILVCEGGGLQTRVRATPGRGNNKVHDVPERFSSALSRDWNMSLDLGTSNITSSMSS